MFFHGLQVMERGGYLEAQKTAAWHSIGEQLGLERTEDARKPPHTDSE